MAETKKLNKLGLTQVWTKITELFASKTEVSTINTTLTTVKGTTETNSSEIGTIKTSKADKATTLEGYGISDAYTKVETDSKISDVVTGAISGIYVVKGSVAFASLPTENVKEGYVYNVTDAFTTTENFLEGAGVSYPAGTNVVYTEGGKWDCMAGTYDFSEYMKSADLVDITEEEINAICVLAGK